MYDDLCEIKCAGSLESLTNAQLALITHTETITHNATRFKRLVTLSGKLDKTPSSAALSPCFSMRVEITTRLCPHHLALLHVVSRQAASQCP